MSAPGRPQATTIVQGAPRAVSLGEWCVQRELVTRAQVDDCLAAQRVLGQDGRKAPRLGQMLLERGLLKLDDLLRALASQRREIRHCPRCRFQTTVPVGSEDAVSCTACRGELVPSPDAAAGVREEFFVAPSRDSLPEEVGLASRNPAARFGKYVLVRELGSGGVGRVFLAWDTFLSQYVAVKRLRTDFEGQTPEAIEERRKMLLQEARSAIRLRHPGIVCVYDVGRIDGEPYISMEYVEGETLHDRIQASALAGHLSFFGAEPETTLKLLGEVARAVDYAHTAPSPLIHCDLKPSNIMIGRDAHARILDFGLARNLKADAKEQSDFISGTPAYMSPEQARGDLAAMDARTDIYAFGAILYEGLTGRTPFTGAPFEILHATLNLVPESPREVLAARRSAAPDAPKVRIPAALESLCMSCLERDPGRRPFSLQDVATTLDAVLETPTTPPTPPPLILPPRPSLSPRPSRRTLRLISGALVLALLGLGLSSLAGGTSEADAELAGFRPERARRVLPDRRFDEIHLVRTLKARLIAALRTSPPRPAELRLRGGLAVAVQGIEGADDAGLAVSTPRGPARIAWESIEPREILSLIRLALPSPSPADRLGLAVYALKAGLPEEARLLLQSLRDTACAPQAERYLHEVQP